MSENVGVGISLGVNVISRDTQAYIGAGVDPNSGKPLAPDATKPTMITASGPVTVDAVTDGSLWTASLAAAITTEEEPEAPTQVTPNAATIPKPDDLLLPPTDTGAILLGLIGDPKLADSQTNVAAAGDVSMNIIDLENTFAFINTGGTVTATNAPVSVRSEAQTAIWSLSGSAAFVESEKSSVGIAGSISVNVISADTQAFVSSATVTARTIDVEAGRGGGIRALSAGGAGAPSKQGLAIAGSFSVNAALYTVSSYVSGAVLMVQDDSSVTADDASDIWSVGGALAYGGAVGIGAGVAINLLGTQGSPNITSASVANSTVTVADGTLEVAADNVDPSSDPRIIAVTAAFAAASGQKPQFAGAGMISVNLIYDQTTAEITGSTVSETSGSKGTVSIDVSATDTSGIVSIGGAISGVSKGVAVGAGIGYNEIQTATVAAIEGSHVTIPGDLSVTAESNASIAGVSLGVAVNTGNGLAGAGSASLNIIRDTIDAHISSSSNVAVGGPVTVGAADHSLIVSLAGDFSLARSGGAVGASISFNQIGNTIEAYVAGSTVTSSQGDVSLSASSSPLLVAISLQGAGSSNGTTGAGSLTINAVTNTVDAHIVGSTVTATIGDVTVNSGEGASEYVFSLGASGSLKGNSAGAALAFNFLGGLASPNPDILSYQDGSVAGSTSVSVTADAPIAANAEIHLPNHGFATGTAVVYHAGGGTPIGGLVDGQTYYVIAVDSNDIQLASSAADATAGNAIALSSTGGTVSNQTFTLTKLQSTPAVSFNPANSSISGNEIYLFNVEQTNGTLLANDNVPLPGTAPKIQVSGSAMTALFGTAPTTTSNSITGSATAAASTTITGSDNTLVVKVNGASLNITLTAGTYTPAGLAAELQKELNGAIFAQDHLTNGEALVYDNGGGTSIDGLIEGASYYIIRAADNGIELAASQAGAVSTPPVPVTLGPNLGSGTGHTLTPLMASPAATFGPSAVNAVITNGNTIGFADDTGLFSGEPVTYNSNGGSGIGGLTDGHTYYVVFVDSTHIQLDSSPTDAASASPTQIIPLTATTGTGTFTVQEPSSGVTAYIDSSTVTAGGDVKVLSGFDNPTTLPDATTLNINPSSNITVSGDAIHFATPHGLTTGQEVIYHSGGGSGIGGLTDGHAYYAIVLDPYTIKLAATYNDALSGTTLQANVTVVNAATNVITLSSSNLGLYTGRAIVYAATSGTAIGGLTDGQTYYVISVYATHIMLADSLNDANADRPISLTSAGAGTIVVPTAYTAIPLSSQGNSSAQTLTPLNVGAGASFNPSSQSVTLPGSTIPAAAVTVSQNVGTLTITSNDAQFLITGGNAESGLLGSAPTTSGDAITGSASANLTITSGSNDTIQVKVNGRTITVTLKPLTYTADSLAAEVQADINAAIENQYTVTNAITFTDAHGLLTGQEVVYHASGGVTVTQNNGTLTLDSNGPQIQVAGSAAQGLFGGSPSIVTTSTDSKITGSAVATLGINASNDTLNLTLGGTTFTITLTHGTYTAAALAALLEQEIDDLSGLQARYAIGGLTDGTTYYVIKVNDDSIQLASTQANANAGKALTLSSLGYGTGQSFTPTAPASALTFGASRGGDHQRRGRRDLRRQQFRPGHRRRGHLRERRRHQPEHRRPERRPDLLRHPGRCHAHQAGGRLQRRHQQPARLPHLRRDRLGPEPRDQAEPARGGGPVDHPAGADQRPDRQRRGRRRGRHEPGRCRRRQREFRPHEHRCPHLQQRGRQGRGRSGRPGQRHRDDRIGLGLRGDLDRVELGRQCLHRHQ